MKQIYALGVGHNTPVFIDLALVCGYEVVGLYHYNGERTGQLDHGFEILGSFDDLFAQSMEGKNFLLTMGDCRIKADLQQRILAAGGNVPTLIHPSAVISTFAKIHPQGVYISPFTYVQADSEVETG
ncbi:MAG: transferase, partial [Paludibacteraceae bacterium]|nr:transferase [Paludibacteraceae bacterium]